MSEYGFSLTCISRIRSEFTIFNLHGKNGLERTLILAYSVQCKAIMVTSFMDRLQISLLILSKFKEIS